MLLEVVMTKGGARPNSGPPPDPNALRRDRKGDGEWVTLPARRTGPAPEWPLVEMSDREEAVWDRYWTKPQAVLWEMSGQEFEVAMHVRQLVAAEGHDAAVNARTLFKQQLDSLLLTLPAMRSARIRIAADEVSEHRDTKPAERRPSSRQRMKVVAGGDA